MFSAPLSAKGAEELAKMVEGGTLKIIVDSMFKMEDALMVCLLSLSLGWAWTVMDGKLT